LPYVTTKRFLKAFGLASLRDLPDVERLEEEGLSPPPRLDARLDGVWGISGEDNPPFEDAMEFDAAGES